MDLGNVDLSPEKKHNSKIESIKAKLADISICVDELRLNEEKVDPGDIRELNIKDLNEIRDDLGNIYKMIFKSIEFNKHQAFRRMNELMDKFDKQLLK